MTMAADSGAVALVTGAGRGIGRAIAIELARQGYALCLAARTFEELLETRRLSGLAPHQCLIVMVDLTEIDAPEHLFRAAIEHYGRVDVLINNAGGAPPRTPLSNLSPREIDSILALNLRAPVGLAHLAARHMSESGRGGAIINIASIAARDAAAGETVYAAAKAGLVTFTHACFNEFRQQEIRVAVVIPGLTDTRLIPHNKRLNREAMLRPEDVAAAVTGVLTAGPGSVPVEIVLQPARDPLRAR